MGSKERFLQISYFICRILSLLLNWRADLLKKKNKTKRCILSMIKHPRDITTKVVEKILLFESQLRKLYGYSL